MWQTEHILCDSYMALDITVKTNHITQRYPLLFIHQLPVPTNSKESVFCEPYSTYHVTPNVEHWLDNNLMEDDLV